MHEESERHDEEPGEDVGVPVSIPPGATEEDLNVGPEPDGKPITRDPVVDSEETA